jgi:hypothetical protein
MYAVIWSECSELSNPFCWQKSVYPSIYPWPYPSSPGEPVLSIHWTGDTVKALFLSKLLGFGVDGNNVDSGGGLLKSGTAAVDVLGSTGCAVTVLLGELVLLSEFAPEPELAVEIPRQNAKHFTVFWELAEVQSQLVMQMILISYYHIYL